jgi:acetylxylan esterase
VCIPSLTEPIPVPFSTFLTTSRWVYKPDTVKSNALVVATHSCQSSGQKYFQNSKLPWHQGSNRKGYVTVWPSSMTECWDVSSKASLTHNGGGDSNTIANMIKYAITAYRIDPKKIYVTGGSSGGEILRFQGVVVAEG